MPSCSRGQRSRQLAANFVVNSSGNASDAAPGDGVCEATTGLADCTVQAAVQESSALAGNDAIVLPAGDFLADPFLGIEDAVIVAGAGAASTSILGNGTDTVLYFYVNVDVTLCRRHGRSAVLAATWAAVSRSAAAGG